MKILEFVAVGVSEDAPEEMAKRQFKMWLSDELSDQLAAAAERTGRGSSQQVVEEILTIYLPLWNAVQISMRRAVDYQLQHLSENEVLSAAGKVVLLENAGRVVDGASKRTKGRKAG